MTETRRVSLHLWNTEGEYRYWRDRAKEAVETAIGDREEAVELLADEMKQDIIDEAPTFGRGFYHELLTSALNKVDWRELAEDFIEDVYDEDEWADDDDERGRR